MLFAFVDAEKEQAVLSSLVVKGLGFKALSLLFCSKGIHIRSKGTF
jgi:hypothetical protein